jgi:general secretion pathway protein K
MQVQIRVGGFKRVSGDAARKMFWCNFSTSRRSKIAGTSTDSGFALIVVIWMAGLVGLLAIGFISGSRSYVRDTASAAQTARAEALADAGVNLAVLDLVSAQTDPNYSRRFPLDATAVTCAVAPVDVIEVRVQDSGGRINLNSAGPRLLQSLFLGLGLNLDTASRYTDRIIDYRDPDDDQLPNGAERPAYLAAGHPPPKNAPFDSVEELHQVLGLDENTIAAIEDHLTLYSGMAGVNPKTVSKELAEILRRGEGQLEATDQQRADSDGLPFEFAMSSPQRTFVIDAKARLSTGAVYVREVVLTFSTAQSSFHAFKVWKRGKAFQGPSSAQKASELPPC